jgi:ribosomal-protein-alanine N-acetyltransferase
MAFLRSVSVADPGPVLFGRGIELRVPCANDYAPWAELRARSRDFLVPWEPTWVKDELTRLAYRRRLKQVLKDQRDETGYTFFIFRTADRALLGGLTLSNVRRGVTQACTLGYWMGSPHSGRGFMTEGVRAVIPFVFENLTLHRLEAACLPSNKASMRVLEKNGFVYEGLARRYLKINGIWQDHSLFALVSNLGRV